MDDTLWWRALGRQSSLSFKWRPDLYDFRMIRGAACCLFGAWVIIVGVASTAIAIVEPKSLPKVVPETQYIHSANIFVKDDRLAVSPRGRYFYLAPIGELFSNEPLTLGGEHGYSSSTGFMVSPCHILTTGHGVFGDSLDRNNVDFSDTLYLDFDAYGKARFKAKAIPAIWGSGIGVAQDWALLQIVPCRGASSAIGWMKLGTLSGRHWGKQGLPVSLAGFMSSDKADDQMYLDPSCHAYEVLQSSWFTEDCAEVQGSSGSPIFIMKPGGLPEVVGIVCGSMIVINGIIKKFGDDTANTALNIDDIRAEEPGFQREINRGLAFFASKVPGAHNPQLDMLKAQGSPP